MIPTKAMLFSDKDSSRLADECKTAAMVQGAPAPTQSNAINKTNNCRHQEELSMSAPISNVRPDPDKVLVDIVDYVLGLSDRQHARAGNRA